MKRTRPAFTLVELLVVMALMAVLATLTIAFFPGVASSAREARAASLLQGWLNIAKQRALRDRTPNGVRLIVNPANPGQVIECQYVAQPDDFSVGRMVTVDPAPYSQVAFNFAGTSADLLNGYALTATDLKYWAVQPGDYLEVNGNGLMHRITSVTSASTVQVSPPLPNKISTQCSYRIVRAPPVGDETLKLPDTAMIDISTNTTFGNPLPPLMDAGASGYIDIVFAPSGQVISRNVATDKIHLWVRTPNTDFPNDPFRGEPTLVSIFVRSGFIGAYQPDPTNAYSLVK